MRQLILTIGGAELQPAQFFSDLRVKTGNSSFKGRSLSLLNDHPIYFMHHLIDDLLDLCRMYPAVENQFIH